MAVLQVIPEADAEADTPKALRIFFLHAHINRLAITVFDGGISKRSGHKCKRSAN